MSHRYTHVGKEALSRAAKTFPNYEKIALLFHGSGRDIIVQAESSSEARRTVLDMFPRAVVTGVSRVK